MDCLRSCNLDIRFVTRLAGLARTLPVLLKYPTIDYVYVNHVVAAAGGKHSVCGVCGEGRERAEIEAGS